VVGPRRPGDPAMLIASSELIQADLGWRPSHDLRTMVADQWQFALARAALRQADAAAGALVG
jgi:UDP-glucose 4-epimerase